MTDAALRQQIAQWTRAALGELVEDDGALVEIAPVVEQTTCCIVGSGPAGVMLALLLARQGIPVILLEAQTDFDRDFRGDALQASALEILDELDLADRLLQIRHTKLSILSIQTDAHHRISIDLTRLHTRYPYMTMLPHTDLLDVMLTEAKRYPTFRLVMGAHVERLIKEGGAIRGVRFRGQDGWHEVRASLTIGADGRFSWVRRLLDWQPVPVGPATDVFWFGLPWQPGDPEALSSRSRHGSILKAWKHAAYWQFAYLVPQGSDRQWRAPRLQILRQIVAELLPEFADRAESLRGWEDVWFLSLEPSRLVRWYRPGLLLIGDAAHVMAPLGDVGITCAMQDAVVAANVLAGPLRAGRLRTRDLARVQRRREWPVRIMQRLQVVIQLREGMGEVVSNKPFKRPLSTRLLLHLPGIGILSARILALGVRRVHIKH